MKPAPGSRATALHLVVLSLLTAPLAAQESCPRASGPDAEAGWAAYASNDVVVARMRFDAALQRCAGDQYARTGLGYVALREGALDEAARLWSEVVTAQPNSVDALTGLGLVAWRRGDVDAVRQRFERVLALVPDHQTALEYMGRIEGAARSGEPDAADEAWLRGDTELAVELYSIRLSDDPRDDVAALRVGLARAWSGDHDGALVLLDGILARDESNVDARLARARILAWSGDLAGAQREASQILAEQPDNPEALEALAQFQAWAGDVDQALASYERLTSIAPQSGSVGRSRAQALAWASRYEASRSAYDSLIARNPGDVEARLGLARTLAYSQSFDEAIVEYDRIALLEPGEIRAVIGKARTLGWAGRLVQGEATAVRAVEMAPSSADAWAGLGELYVWEGRDAAALSAFETAARLAPTNALVLDQLRSVRLSLAPAASPSVSYESDSDDNVMVTTSLSAGWHPVPRLNLAAHGFYKDLQQGIFKRYAAGASLLTRYQLQPGWVLTGGVGGSTTNGTGRPSLFEYRAAVRSPERRSIVASVELSSVGLNETAALAELGGRATGVVASATWMPTGALRLDGSVGVGRYEGSEDNGRRSALLAASYRLGRSFSLGASFEGFSFEKDLDDGYFDPDFYGIVELTSYWLHRPLPWRFLVELAPGVEQVTTEGDLSPTLRSNVQVGYEFLPGREVSASFGYSNAGLARFAKSTSDYRYMAFTLGSSWVF